MVPRTAGAWGDDFWQRRRQPRVTGHFLTSGVDEAVLTGTAVRRIRGNFGEVRLQHSFPT
jgi:hypothetical protein